MTVKFHDGGDDIVLDCVCELFKSGARYGLRYSAHEDQIELL